MPNSKNPYLQSHKIDFPIELSKKIQKVCDKEDENISSLIRKVMANYVGWEGPTRNIKNYRPSKLETE